LPDLALVRGQADDYRNQRPGPADVGLVIEVADTSLRKDLTRALEGYARAMIPVYWIINLVARRIEVYSRPVVREGVPVYESLVAYGPDDSVPLVLDGREVARIPARDILPIDPGPAQP
jgi:Uma2 family endonuclease